MFKVNNRNPEEILNGKLPFCAVKTCLAFGLVKQKALNSKKDTRRLIMSEALTLT